MSERASSRVFRSVARLAVLLLAPSLARAEPAPTSAPSAPAPPPAAAPAPAANTEPDAVSSPPPEAPPEGEAAPTPSSSAPPSPPAAPPPPPCPASCAAEAERTSSRVRYELEGVVIRGNTRTSRRVVMRYVPFHTGDIIDVSDKAFELLRYRLLGTGFFRAVDLSLEKGARRGQVVLVIEVQERNTIVVNDIWMGLSKDADVQGEDKGKGRPLSAYAGIDIAETNLAGTGITLGGAVAFAQNQLALRARFLDPAFFGSTWMVDGTLLYTNAHDFFGNANVYTAYTSGGVTGLDYADYAVVAYQRFGGILGLGRDLSVSTQVWLHYRLESVHASYPNAAYHSRGYDEEPIDFNIIRGSSVLSTLRGTLQHDTRDHPFLPTKGWLATMNAELALLPAALDYDYQKVEIGASHWWALPFHRHVIALELYGGAIAGHAPFFEQFYVGDLSDFLPDRVLGMNFDRRPPPNFLGTQIVENRYANYAAKIATEYRIPLYRGRRSVYGVDFFAGGGIYGLASARTITDPPTGYTGLARIPIDLTASIGVRADTAVGGFNFSLSNALGFVLVGKGPAAQKGNP